MRRVRFFDRELAQTAQSVVVSCDGVLGNEAKLVLQNLAGMLAKKSEKSYSETSNIMKSSMSIAIVRGKSHIYASEDHTSPL